MLAQRTSNPLAPPVYNGLSSVCADFSDDLVGKSFEVTLTAGQNLLNQSVPLDRDADFFLLAVTITGPNKPFAFRLSDSTGFTLSDSYISSMAFQFNVGTGSPFTLLPAFWLPSGSSILIDLIEQSLTTNGPIKFLFQGLKRYK